MSVAPATAILRPMKPKQQTHTVDLLARVRDGKIKVRLQGPVKSVFAVYRFRLFRTGRRDERVADAVFDALPWGSAGIDPLVSATLDDGDLGLIREPA